MATAQLNGLVRHIRRMAMGNDAAGMTDGELLKRFVGQRDEAAFAALVRRYGPLVLGVCRRVLHHRQDAEDAFQATFLVLLHKAGSIAPPELVGNWLYGVAYFTAKNAKISAARRRNREREVSEMPRAQAVGEEDALRELRPLLDEELSRLPEKYRVPIVLCELHGESRKEVARHLGCAEGTLSRRLARGRQMLQKRLTKRGLALSAASLAVALSRDVASASVPAPLVASTIKTALLVAASPAPAVGIVSGPVAALTEGVLKTMFLAKLKTVTAVLLAIGVVASVGLFAHQTLAQRSPEQQEGTPSPGKEDTKPARADPKPAQAHLKGQSSAEEPRAVIQKALQAMGGEALAHQVGATHLKAKGVNHGRGGTFSLEHFAQFPNHYKDVAQFVPHGTKAGPTPKEIAILDGENARWGAEGEAFVQVQGADLDAMQKTAYAMHVSTLVPLLDGKGYQLSLLKPQQLDSRPAIGVLVTAEGRPDVKLYFDKASSLLAKMEFRFNGILEERFFSDYREVNSAAVEENVLKAAGLATDTPALLNYLLRQKTVSQAEQEKSRALIRDLGASSFNVREKATNELIARGTAVVPLLSQAVNDPDPEIASRVKRCLETIGKNPDAVPGAVVRLLALRKSAGAAEMLLAYLPSASEGVADQVQAALAALAFSDGKPEKALLRALEDKDPSRRAAACAAFGRYGQTTAARPGQRLLVPGYKKAMKVGIHRDGKKLIEYEITEIELFNKLDPQVLGDSRQPNQAAGEAIGKARSP